MENRSFTSSGEKTDMEDLDALRGDVERALNLTRAYIGRTDEMEWRPDLGNYRTFSAVFAAMLRGLLLKQFESLEVILDLVGRNKGAVAGPLLRPACEEFIWVKYLASISLSDAEHILRLVGLEETYKSLTATNKTAGISVIEQSSLEPYLEEARKHKKKRHDALSEIGEKLSWPEKEGRIQIPSISWLAKKVEQKDMYNRVYHATSRFAHFSAAELGRRVWWSKPDEKLLIGSFHFADHWNRFCLHWGALLFIYTMREILGFQVIREDDRATGRDVFDFSPVEDVGKRIDERGMPPIISSRELAWPDEWAD